MQTGELVGLHIHIREEIVNAYRVVFPHYDYNKTCPVCVAEMLTKVYKWHEQYTQQQ